MRTLPWLALGTAALVGCSSPQPPQGPLGGASKPDVAEAAGFTPLPAVIEGATSARTPEKVALGRMLYYDTRFSTDGGVACYTCHPLHDYGVDHRQKGVGNHHLQGDRNDPTVYNAAGDVAQFWDGRSPDVEAQALGPVLNPVEMGMKDSALVVAVIRSIPAYPEAFRRAFPDEADPVSFHNFGQAVGAFERGLTTPSRWDEYLGGDPNALTAREKQGLRTFVAVGCSSCHTATYVGGSMFRKVGMVEPWPNQQDQGRFKVTNQPADRMVFKVPSLRNVNETWPYFHDGSVQHLDDAIRMMGHYQLGRNLSDEQVALIRDWLKTLTGDINERYIARPDLPPSASAGRAQAGPRLRRRSLTGRRQASRAGAS